MPSGQGVLEPSKSVVRLTSCFGRGNGTSTEHGSVAQLVAHLHGMQGVRGSSPLRSTRTKRLSRWEGLFSFLPLCARVGGSPVRCAHRGAAFWGLRGGCGPRMRRLDVVGAWAWAWSRASRGCCAHRGVAFSGLRGGEGPGRVVSAWCGCGCARAAGAALTEVSRSGRCAGVGAQDASSRRGAGVGARETRVPRSSMWRVLGAAREWGPGRRRLDEVLAMSGPALRAALSPPRNLMVTPLATWGACVVRRSARCARRAAHRGDTLWGLRGGGRPGRVVSTVARA